MADSAGWDGKYVQELIERFSRGRKAAELSRASGGLVDEGNFYKLLGRRKTLTRMPENPTIIGLTDALGLGHDDDVLLAFARGFPGLRIRPAASLLVERMPSTVARLDPYGEVVDSQIVALDAMARAVIDLEDRAVRRRPHDG